MDPGKPALPLERCPCHVANKWVTGFTKNKAEVHVLTFSVQIHALLSSNRALTLTPDDDDDENAELKWYDYFTHFISMPWKLFCAIIPPKHYGGGFISFVWSILWLGLMSVLVEQVAWSCSLLILDCTDIR